MAEATDAVGREYANRIARLIRKPTATYTDKCSLCKTALKGKKNTKDQAIHLKACVLRHFGEKLRSEHETLAKEAGYLTACPVAKCKGANFATIGDLGVHLHTHRKTTKCGVEVGPADDIRKPCGHVMAPARNSFQAHMETAHGLLPLTSTQSVSPAVNYCLSCDEWQLGYEEIYAHRNTHVDEVIQNTVQDPRALGYDSNNTASLLVEGLYCPFCLGNEDIPMHERGASFMQRRAQIIHIVNHIMTMAADGLQDIACPFQQCAGTFSPPDLADHLISAHSFRLAGVAGRNQRRNAQSLLIQGDLFKLVMEPQHRQRWEKAIGHDGKADGDLSADLNDLNAEQLRELFKQHRLDLYTAVGGGKPRFKSKRAMVEELVEFSEKGDIDIDIDSVRVANNLGMWVRHPRAPPPAPEITPRDVAYYNSMSKLEVIRLCKDKGVVVKDDDGKYEPHGVLIQRLVQAATADE